MNLIRRNAKLASVFLTILMLYITVPFDSVLAAIIETEATLDSPSAQQARDEINKLLLREDVQNTLMAQGINPLEAKARIDNLSDAEVVQLADQINKLPAGSAGSMAITPPAWVIVVAIAIVVGLVVLIVFGIYKLAEAGREQQHLTVQYSKPAGDLSYNPEEPWTGVWDVQGSVHFSGRWRMTQTGSTVSSTKDSVYEIKGKAKGNQLKGKISSSTSSSQFNSFVINISPDGLSFEGTCDLSWQKNLPVKGRREQ